MRLPADCRPGRRLRAPHGGNLGYPAVSGSGLLYSTEGAEQSAAVTDLTAAECCSVRPGRAGLSVCRGTAGGAGSLQKTTIVVSSMQEHLDNNRARVGCNTHTKEIRTILLHRITQFWTVSSSFGKYMSLRVLRFVVACASQYTLVQPICSRAPTKVAHTIVLHISWSSLQSQ